MMKNSAATALNKTSSTSATRRRTHGNVARTRLTGWGIWLRSTAPTRRSSIPL